MRTPLEALPTPCLLLERAVLERNAERMRTRAAELGVALRPHLKTVKCAEAARILFDDASPPRAAVSTLDEARFFRNAISNVDLMWATTVAPGRLSDPLVASGAVAVAVDDLALARSLGLSHRVFIEVDSGQHRGGIEPQDPMLLDVARVVGRRLAGVMTHAGHSYACRGAAAFRALAETERAAAVSAAESIRAAGIACPEVSVGSTPTACFASDLSGVTELRAGVYAFFDRFQAAIGVCDPQDIAVSVLSTVITRRSTPRQSWIDAGALALSQDRSVESAGGSGYAEALTLDGRPVGLVDEVHQVHGRIPDVDLSVGTKVRLRPNHACTTAAMFDRYFVVEGELVVAEWPRLKG